MPARLVVGAVLLAAATVNFTGYPAITRAAATAPPGALPLAFEPNRGQAGSRARFVSRGPGHTLLMESAGASLAVQRSAAPGGKRDRSKPADLIRLRWIGANPEPAVEGMERLPGISNYFLGDDPKGWRTAIPHYAKVRYRQVYSGIDLVFYGSEGSFEYDFIVSPGADPERIQLAFEGAASVSLDSRGDLILAATGGAIVQRRPKVYQEIAGSRREVASRYELARQTGHVRIALGRYDKTLPLVIDPILQYATYVGGSVVDYATAVAVDGAGNAYITGATESSNFPAVSALQPSHGTGICCPPFYDAFIMKLNATGTAVLYSTYLGGGFEEYAHAISVDGAGNAYVTGTTGGYNFPLRNSIRPQRVDGWGDVFVTKLNAAGSALVYSTILDGSFADVGYGIAVDAAGNAFVTGLASSNNFFTSGPLQPCTSDDVFVAKISPDGLALLYCTCIGQVFGDDYGRAIAVDAAGNAYVTGRTTGSFPVVPSTGAFQRTHGGNGDAFVLKLNPSGSRIVYSTYLGGSLSDTGYGIAVDPDGNAYITGTTASLNFPRANAFQGGHGGGEWDAFLTKLNAAGTVLMYSTYLGGSEWDEGRALAVDRARNAYVTGFTYSADFPTANATQPANAGQSDVFVTRLDPDGRTMLFSTYFGGYGNDIGHGIAVDSRNDVYLAGQATQAFNFPRAASPPLFPHRGGSMDAFVAKLANANLGASEIGAQAQRRAPSAPAGGNVSFVHRIVNSGPQDADNVTAIHNIPAGLTLVSCAAAGGSCTTAGNTATIRAAELPAGQSVDVTITAQVASSAAEGTVFTATTFARADTNDTDLSDNIAVSRVAVSSASVCSFSIMRRSATAPPEGDVHSASVAASSPACAWQAQSGVPWITATPQQHTGTGTLRMAVAPNTGIVQRTGTVAVAGATYTITQAAAGCQAALSSQSGTVPAAGGSSSFSVATGPGCSWTAAAAPDWAGVTNPPSTVTGPGPVEYSAAPNPGAARTASISVAGQYFQILQAAASPAQTFHDVPLSHPYFSHIGLLKDRAVTSGCTANTYCPDASALRSQMAVFIIRSLLGDNFDHPAAAYFTDVPPTHPHFRYVQKMRQLGIAAGCTTTTYCPDDPVTRGQMAVFLIRARLAVAAGEQPPFPPGPYFSDVASTHPYYSYVQKLKQLGITGGCTATGYCPDAPTTRGQMAVFLIRTFFTP